MLPPLIPSLLILAAGLGLLLIALGLRGRIATRGPHCRRCRFDLAGLADPAVCPECGGDLHGKRPIRPHRRRRIKPAIALGLLLLLSAGGLLVFTLAPAAQSLKPTILLHWELKLGDVASRTAALGELTRRLEVGKLEDEAISVIFDTINALPLAEYSTLEPAAGGFVEAAVISGGISQPQILSCIRNSVKVDLQIRKRVGQSYRPMIMVKVVAPRLKDTPSAMAMACAPGFARSRSPTEIFPGEWRIPVIS